MADEDPQLSVTRNEDQSRYEIHVGDTLGGYAEYFADGHGRTVFPATEIDPAFKGRGLGTTLVAEALADEAQRGQTVVPRCPFVVRYLERNDVPGLDVHWPDGVKTPE